MDKSKITDKELENLYKIAEQAYSIAWETIPDPSGIHDRILKYSDPKHSWLRQLLNAWHQSKNEK